MIPSKDTGQQMTVAVAKQGKRNWQSSEAKLPQQDSNPGPGPPGRQSNAISSIVGRILWICKIHGSRCAMYGSLVRAGIHGSRRVRSTGSLYRPYLKSHF